MRIFSEAFGLVFNSENSTIYITGVCPRIKDEIKTHFLLPIGKLPFKYLGVPLFSKRNFDADCDLLVDKMTSRIGTW